MSTNSLPLTFPGSVFSDSAADRHLARTIRVERNIADILLPFVFLQVLDVLTTLVGLRVGASEASPMIRVLLHAGPVTGLILSKVIGLALCGICLYVKKRHLIRWANYWYSGLVVWNLFIILSVLSPK